MEINDPQVHEELCRQFDRYEQALLNNDVAVLNEFFWDSEFTVRYGIGENHYGYADIAEYRRNLPPQDMTRIVSRSVITTYGQDAATTNIEFIRGGHKGRQSQVWMRMPEGWRIVAAHVSFISGTG